MSEWTSNQVALAFIWLVGAREPVMNAETTTAVQWTLFVLGVLVTLRVCELSSHLIPRREPRDVG